MRVAAVVEGKGGQRILIDTPPELRLQLVAANIGAVDAVLYTHDHADHVHGIDDLRAVSVRHGPLPLLGPPDSVERLRDRFRYIFDRGIVPPTGSSKPELTLQSIPAGVPVSLAGVEVLPLAFDHGRLTVYGYRFGPLAYLTDVKTAPPESVERLQGVQVLVVNALFDRPHPAHLSIPEAIELAQRVGAERTILTHLTHRFGHRELEQRLPAGVEPAYDGLTVAF